MKNWLTERMIKRTEAGRLPDSVVRWGIRRLLKERLSSLPTQDCEQQQKVIRNFLDAMQAAPIAMVPEKANEQHYELPPEFFSLVLGDHQKYSSAFWDKETQTLTEAEAASLQLTCEHADLQNGQMILELGCGWGSLSLWIAQRYPQSEITAVSNSQDQREYIQSEAEKHGLSNLNIITADINEFVPDQMVDRIISVEMFEHLRNHQELLRRISTWLNPQGKLLIHIFCHKNLPYFFETEGTRNWMGRYFFTGGMMPADCLPALCQDEMRLTQQWRWNGTHYQKTSDAWLANLDKHHANIQEIFRTTYGAENAKLWIQRWRLFFLAVSELFGYRNGQEWWVSHYLMQPRPISSGNFSTAQEITLSTESVM